MPRVLQSVKLYGTDRITLVHDWSALIGRVAAVTVEEELGQEARATLELADAALASMAADFSFRRALRLDFGGGDVEWWRVVSRTVSYTPGGPPALVLRPLWRDLGDRMYRSTTETEAAGGRVYLVRRPVADALAAVLDPATGAPAFVAAGAVDPKFDDVRVTLTGSAVTHLDLLYAIAEQAACEVTFRWVEADGKLYVDLVEQVGDSDPGDRRVDLATAFALSRDDDGTGFASRITPVGGSGDETFLAGGALWPLGVTLYDYDGGQERTTFTTSGGPVAYDGEFVGGFILTRSDNKLWPILETTAPDTFVIGHESGGPGLVPGRWQEFQILDAAQEPIDSFADENAEAAFGVVESPLLVEGAVPFGNLAGLFGSADLSDWDGGLPGGFQKIGTPTVTEEADPEFAQHGTKAARVVCSADGQGLSLGYVYSFPWDGKDYVSAWVAVRVISGTIRVRLTGVNDPPSQEFSDPTTRAVEFVGAKRSAPPISHGSGSVVVEAVGGPAEFVWDAVVVTHSGTTAYTLESVLGPNALWNEARTALSRLGGGASIVQGFDAEAVDLEGLGLAAEPLGLGDTLTLEHEGLPSSTVRVTRVEVEHRPGFSAETKRFRLGKRLPQFDIGGGFGGGPTLTPVPGSTGGGGAGADATLQLLGTADQITFTPAGAQPVNGPLVFQAALPQDVAPTSSPTFASPTLTGTLAFSGGSRQWLDAPLATAGADPAGMGTQSNTLYLRTPKRFSVFMHGGHANLENNPGTGGSTLFSVWDTGIAYRGFTVWHQDNDGPGSGLDADLLDGYEAVAFPRKAENATITGNWTHQGSWTQASGRSSLTISAGNLLQSGNAFTVRTAGLTLRTDGGSIAFNRSGINLGVWNDVVLDVSTDLGVGGHTDLDSVDVAGAAHFFDTATFSDPVLSAQFNGLVRNDVDTHTYGHALPGLHWGSDLGTQSRQWRTLFVGEIRAAVLVASQEIATVNEVFVVGAGNALAEAMTDVQTTITLRYNNYQNGYYVVLKGFDAVTGLPSAEIVKLTSAPTTVVVNGNTCYRFDCQRAVLFSAHDWAEGQGCATTYGAKGRGWIESYAVQSYVTDATTAGPTTVFWERTGTGVLDVAPRAATGNLRGLYNFAADKFGFAAGYYTGAWVSVTEEVSTGGGGIGVVDAGGLEFWSADTLLAWVRAGTFDLGAGRVTYDGTTFEFVDWTATTEELARLVMVQPGTQDEGTFHIRLRAADTVAPGTGFISDRDLYKIRGLHLQSLSVQGGAGMSVGEILTDAGGVPAKTFNNWFGVQAMGDSGAADSSVFFQLGFNHLGNQYHRIAGFKFNTAYLEHIGSTMKFGTNVSDSKSGLWVDADTYIYTDGEASFGGFSGVYKQSQASGGTVWIGTGVRWGNFTGSVWRLQGEFEQGAVRFRSKWFDGLVEVAATRLYWESDDGSDDLILESTTTDSQNPTTALRGGRLWAAHQLDLEAPGGGLQGWTGKVRVSAGRFQLLSGTLLQVHRNQVTSTVVTPNKRLELRNDLDEVLYIPVYDPP